MGFATVLNRKNRLVSMISDQVSMTIIMMVFGVPVYIFYWVRPLVGEYGSGYFVEFSPGGAIYVAFVFSLYFNKDIYLGQSIGKRLLRFYKVNKKTGESAGPLRCLVRNLTLIFWPVEAILAMLNVQERLGDYIAGTKLVNYERAPEGKADWGMMGVSLLLGFGFVYVAVVLPMLGFLRLMTGFGVGGSFAGGG